MIDSEVEAFLKEGRTLAKLATVSDKGWPQVTPIWYLYENGHIYMTTVPTRKKARNIAANPRVAIFVDDPSDSQKGVEIQGKASFIQDKLEEWNRRIAGRYIPSAQLDRTVRGLMSDPRVILDITPMRVAKIGSNWPSK